jgi:hypothetical protein
MNGVNVGGAAGTKSVLYPNHYLWYILAATLDVLVTYTIITHLGGSEVNGIADALIQRFGAPGMIGLKFSTIAVVLLICEFVGRRSFGLGRRLATAAVVVSALPAAIGLAQVYGYTQTPAPTILVYDDGDGGLTTLAAPAASPEPEVLGDHGLLCEQ